MMLNILDAIFKIFMGLVAGFAGAIAVLLGVDLMFRVGDSSLFEVLDEIERLEKENEKYEDDDN